MRAVIFDFDYTLGDSTEGILACIAYGLEKLGFPPASREDMRATIGLSLGPTLEKLTGCGDTEAAREFTRLFMEKADEVMVASARFYPDALPLLESLHNAGIKTAIVTTKASYRIEGILEKFGARSLVDVIMGSDMVEHEKPHPEPVLMALPLLGVEAGEALYVGDSPVDAQCAASAGVAFAGVLTGTAGREALEAFPHVRVGETLTEVCKEVL